MQYIPKLQSMHTSRLTAQKCSSFEVRKVHIISAQSTPFIYFSSSISAYLFIQKDGIAITLVKQNCVSIKFGVQKVSGANA